MPDIYAHSGNAQMKMDNESTWAAARNASTAETISTTLAKSNSAVKAAANSDGSQYDCYRYFAAFDTSDISVKPDSAKLKLFGFTYGDANIVVIKVNAGATGGASADYVAGDFDQTSSTAYSAEVTSWSTSGYNEITLNDAALSDMASLDDFKVAVIDHDHDFSNAAPANSETVRTGFYFQNETGTSKDPFINYVEGAAEANFSESTPTDNIAKDYTIETYKASVLSAQYNRTGSAQVPFILGTPGPISLRSRAAAPVVDLGNKKN